MSVPAIEFRSVSYSYPGSAQTALSDVSFCIPAGAFGVIVGGNGAGKSTALLLAAGLLGTGDGIPSGEVLLNGKPVGGEQTQLSSATGLVLQDPASQLLHQTVWDEVMTGPQYAGLPWSECEVHAKEAIEQTLGEGFAVRDPAELSGGEQQRVVLAAVIALGASVLLLDEPFSFLDEASGRRVLESILRLWRNGHTVLLATHDLTSISRHADMFVVMDEGRCLAPSVSDEEGMRRWPHLFGLGNAVLPGKSVGAHSHGQLGLSRQGASQQPEVKRGDSPARARPDKVGGSEQVAVSADAVEYTYPGTSRGVKNVSLCVAYGESVGIVGGNGSGKTTLAKLLVGLLRPSAGKVEVCGSNVAALRPTERVRRIGFTTQNPNDMLFEATVLTECAYGPACVGIPQPDVVAKEALERLGITELSDRSPDGLSGGQKRLVSIAAALALGPEALVLDEPEFSLDRCSWRTVLAALRRLSRLGKATLVTTQRPMNLLTICHRMIVMENGSVVAEGPTADVLTHPSCRHLVPRWGRRLLEGVKGRDLTAYDSLEALLGLPG